MLWSLSGGALEISGPLSWAVPSHRHTNPPTSSGQGLLGGKKCGFLWFHTCFPALFLGSQLTAQHQQCSESLLEQSLAEDWTISLSHEDQLTQNQRCVFIHGFLGMAQSSGSQRSAENLQSASSEFSPARQGPVPFMWHTRMSLLEQQFLEINKSLDSVLLLFLSSAVDIMVQQSWVWRVWTFKTRQRGQKVINFLLLMLEGDGGEGKKKKLASLFTLLGS